MNSRAEIRKVHGLTIVILYAKDFSGTIKLTWFNCPFLRNFFHIGQEFVFVGNVAYKGGMMTMTQPEYYTYACLAAGVHGNARYNLEDHTEGCERRRGSHRQA